MPIDRNSETLRHAAEYELNVGDTLPRLRKQFHYILELNGGCMALVMVGVKSGLK